MRGTAFACALAAFSGCSGGRSALLVTVDSSGGAVTAQSLHLILLNNGQTGEGDYVLPVGTIITASSPVTLAARLPADREGQLQITVEARAGLAKLASGQAGASITPGQETDVTVHLVGLAAMGDLGSEASLPADQATGAPPDASVLPDLAVPDLAIPDLLLPDLATPDLVMPDLALPDLAMPRPDLALPDLALPPRNFLLATPRPVGTAPRSIALGDVDGDGTLDLVAGSTGGLDVWTLFHVGDVHPDATARTSLGSAPALVALTDCNGDGDLDLLVGQSTNEVFCMKGNRSGVFMGQGQPARADGPPTSLAFNRDCGKVTVGVAVPSRTELQGGTLLPRDFVISKLNTITFGNKDDPRFALFTNLDGDGISDLVVADGMGGSVITMVTRSGNGMLVPGPPPTAFGKNVIGLATGDFNSDGKTDVASANQGDDTIGVANGDGMGGFVRVTTYGIKGPTAIVAADFDGDGRIDLAATSPSLGAVGFFHGRGGGVFDPAVLDAAGPDPEAIVAGDVDGDGRIDLVVANTAANTITVLHNLTKAPMSFGIAGAVATPLVDAVAAGTADAVADFNNDGHLDVLVHTLGMNGNSGIAAVYPGTFPNGVPGGTATTQLGRGASQIAVGDVNCDGILDLVVAQQGEQNFAIYPGNGRGNFGPPINYPSLANPSGAAIGDFDGNGTIDIAITDEGAQDLQVWAGDGAGNFQVLGEPKLPGHPHRLFAGDLNHDGRTDLVASDTQEKAVIVMMAGQVGVLNGSMLPTGDTSLVVLIADINTDGRLDLVVPGLMGGVAAVRTGNGDGTFGNNLSSVDPGFAGYNTGVLADLDGDGNLDLVLSGHPAGIALFHNQGGGTFTNFNGGNMVMRQNGLANTLLARDLDGDGKVDLVGTQFMQVGNNQFLYFQNSSK